MTRLRAVATAGALALAVAMLAGCSDGGKATSGASAAAGAVTTTTAAVTPAGGPADTRTPPGAVGTGAVTGGSSGPSGPATTVRPVDTSFTGQGSGDFCKLARTLDTQFADIGAASTSAQLRQVVQDGRTALNLAAKVAPAEIKADVQVMADAFGAIFSELDKANFDTTKVSQAAFAPMQAPQFLTSTTRFQAYLHNVCATKG